MLGLLMATAFATTASAAQFTVGSTADLADADPGNGVCATAASACTLRAAIGEANELGRRRLESSNVILPAGTYPIGSTINVRSDVSLTGPAGARATVIQGAGNTPVLELAYPGIEVRGVTVTGGGTGLLVSADDVTVDQVAVRGNRKLVFGSTFGAGIELSSGKLTLTRSSVTGNSNTSVEGIALGGGIYVAAGAILSAIATTIAGNTVSARLNSSYGGGIFVSVSAQATLRHVTLAGNVASGPLSVGGNLAPQGTTAIQDTIIAAGRAGVLENCSSPPDRPFGGNIELGASCGLNLSLTDPQLLPLGDHGGPTDTMPISPGSPARDAAVFCPAGGLDQRGAPAPAGPACDIGAVELSSDLGVTVQVSPTGAPVGGDVTYVARVVNAGPDPAPGAALDITVSGGGATRATVSSGTCASVARCELGTLARGQEVTATLLVRAGAGPITLGLRTSSSVADPVSANDGASVTTPVVVAAGADTTAPRLTALRLVGTARPPRPVRMRMTLSEAATITVRVERLLAGRRVGRLCRVGVRTGPRCAAVRTVGTVSKRASVGDLGLVIPARLARKVRAPGEYRVSATAVDAAGNRSATRRLRLAFAG